MHTNFNFSFIYPVVQREANSGRHRGGKYIHVTDLLINGTGTKKLLTESSNEDPYNFDIDEVIAENENILPLLEKANGLDGIKAACWHHVRQISFGQRADYRMSYLPLKKAI